MEINENIWGLKENWVASTNENQYAEFKFGAVDHQTFYELWNNNYLEDNEIDLSVAFYGIGKDSIWSNPVLIAPYIRDGVSDVYVKPLNEEPKDIPCILGSGSLTGPFANYDNVVYINRYDHDNPYLSQNSAHNRLVVVDFNYQKVVVVPYVEVLNENSVYGDVYKYTLYDYIENGVYNTYNRIVNIGYIFYNGDGDTNRVTRVGPTLFLNFEFEGSADTYEGAIYFADTTGFKMLLQGSTDTFFGQNDPSRTESIDITVATEDTGFRKKYCVGTSSYVQTYFYIPDSLWEINVLQANDPDATSWQVYSYIEVNSSNKSDVKDYVLSQIAFLGFPFVYDPSNALQGKIGDVGVFLPVFDEYGITTGEYLEGTVSLNLDNATWTDSRQGANYDPFRPPTPSDGDYGDTSNLGSARGLLPAGVNIYLMSRSDYNIFMSELNSYYQGSAPDDWTLDFQGVNPSDYILSAYYTPYNFLKSDTKSAVKIGPLTLTTTAYELSEGEPPDDPNKWKTFTYGTRTVTPLFYDFRDYNPYTKVELYLPLAGTVELDTNYVMNHDITVTYYFDLMTLSGVAAVYRDNMLYKTSDFKLGAQVPLLTTNMGQIQNQITQLEFSQKQNNLRLATSAISSGVSIGSILAGGGGEVSTGQAIGAAGGSFALASGIMKADEIDYQLKHTSPSVSVTGAAEPLNNYSVGQLKPKLIIKRPLMLSTLNDEVYSKTIGNSCCINTTLDSMSGLVVCSAIDTTGIRKEISTDVYISPTIDEVNMIKSTFNSGVIL